MENQMLKLPSIHMHAHTRTHAHTQTRTHAHTHTHQACAGTSVGRGLLSSQNGGPWDKTS